MWCVGGWGSACRAVLFVSMFWGFGWLSWWGFCFGWFLFWYGAVGCVALWFCVGGDLCWSQCFYVRCCGMPSLCCLECVHGYDGACICCFYFGWVWRLSAGV